MSYCSVSDLLLGDLELSSRLIVDDYIARAARDMNTVLGRRYVVPVVSAEQFTKDVLASICADLASAYVVMSTAQGGEDNRVNAYGLFLYNRASAALLEALDGPALPGATMRDASAAKRGPVTVTQQDKSSPVETFYNFTQGEPWLPFPRPLAG